MDKVLKKIIVHPKFKVHALLFIPENPRGEIAIFTHGYTSHKASIFSWAQRLCEGNTATVIFDLPGHFLGSFEEVQSFEDFQTHAHELFFLAAQELKKELNFEPTKYILGGHSLGALLALRASEFSAFKNLNHFVITVGFGLNPEHKVHLFDTPLYQKTLIYRNQIVSTALDKDKVFPWIKNAKLSLEVKNHRIHLMSGEDDMVVGKEGLQALVELLEEDNQVTHNFVTKLPHHMPEMAAPHLFSVLKKELSW